MRDNVINHSDYYPFGMRMAGRYGSEDGAYRYGFGGHESDDEVKGEGNHYSFGNYGYDPRLGRRWRPDPLEAGMPAWSPYVNSLDNPIMFVDEDGRWPGVTYFFFDLDIGGGLGYGLNYVEQAGIAYDEVGKTHFTMSLGLHVTNQNLEEYSRDPNMVNGLSGSLTGGVTQDWSHETYLGDVSNYNGELGGIDLGLGIAGELAFGEERLTLKLGIGAGVKMSVMNTQVSESISLTDDQADLVSDATDVWTESWYVENRQYDSENNVWTGTVSTLNTKGDFIDTGVKISSSNVIDENGSNAPSGVWSSQEYRDAAVEAEN